MEINPKEYYIGFSFIDASIEGTKYKNKIYGNFFHKIVRAIP
jgi:hypothetical protein